MKASWTRARIAGAFLVLLGSGSLSKSQSAPVPLVGPAASAVGCFIQSDFVAGGKHNFEVLVLEGTNAIHYWRSNDAPEAPWHKGEIISTQATAPGCLVQSDFMSGGHGNLEAVIPEAGGSLVHYWHDSGNPSSEWNRTGVVTVGVTGGACLITSDYITANHRNFEVMVQKGDQLWHHWHIAGAPFDNWPGELVTSGVTGVGPGCMIQSDYQGGGHRNFEVIVQKGDQLWHHWHWAGMAAGPWPGNSIANGIAAPGCLFPSDYTANNIRNFEVLVQKGATLWHLWHWDGMADPVWPGAPVVSPVSGAGCFLQSDFSAGTHANFEVVVPAPVLSQGSAQSVNEIVHYFQVQQTTPSPWQRAQTVSFQGRSEKVCQLTSDFDWETGIPTTTSTQTNAGLGAVDLGYPVEHDGRLMLLFGDSWATQVAHPGDAVNPKDDAVGWITSRIAPTHAQCTDMAVNSNPGPVIAPATVTGPMEIAQGYFNVPSGGVSDSGGVTAFFWTNHCECPTALDAFAPSPLTRPSPSAACNGNSAVPGCAETDQLNSVGLGVMARSLDGGRTFNNAALMPNGFVYAIALDSNAVDGLPASQRLGTYVFAVPRYRASVPYLAYASPGSLGDPTSWQFFIGRRGDGSPLWVSEEVWRRGTGGAWKPPGSPELFDTDRCIGEFSVTWNRSLGVWLMLYNCGGPIVVRSANSPWGPWSASSEILSPDKDGAPCRLVMTARGCGKQQRYHDQNANVPGGFYAPYILDRYTTPLPSTAFLRRARIYWTLSTWDPYQVSIMRTDLEVAKTRIGPRRPREKLEKRSSPVKTGRGAR